MRGGVPSNSPLVGKEEKRDLGLEGNLVFPEDCFFDQKQFLEDYFLIVRLNYSFKFFVLF